MSSNELNYSNIKDHSVKDLNNLLLQLKEKLFNFRLQKSRLELTNTSLINVTKKQVARVKTVISQKRKEID